MKKLEALREIIRQARAEKSSVAGYKRAQRVCKTLELTNEEARYLLSHLDYINYDSGEPYAWLAAALTKKGTT